MIFSLSALIFFFPKYLEWKISHQASLVISTNFCSIIPWQKNKLKNKTKTNDNFWRMNQFNIFVSTKV